MNKKCARCDKTVYPTEELKCLDKTWHKQCFKCQECGMTLNMRTYKGFNKQPYCEAHIPKAKATTVAETPELRRIAENTKIQSNVMYHAEFEKAKGKFTQVADDPETLRIKQNSKIISNVAYHGDLEKKAIMEQKREKDENGDGPDMQHHPNAVPVYNMPPSAMPHHQQPPATNYHDQYNQQRPEMHAPQKHPQQTGHISDYKVYETEDSQRINYNSPYNQRQSSTVIYTSDKGPVNPQPTRIVGSIADLDPLNDFHGSLVSDYRHQGGYVESGHRRPQMQQQQQQQQQQHKRVQQQQQRMPVQQQQQQMTRVNQMPQHHHQPKETGRVYRAMYDYEARDADEVSFLDGDLLLGCTPIDEGWMTGTVQRTGAQGMLPANYVELAN